MRYANGMEDAAVRAAPDDDAPRLAWARAQGGPRGELVEVQCALARGDATPERRAREAELLAEHGAAWAAPVVFALGAHRWRFVRGFVEHVEITAARFLRRPGLLAETLVRSLRVAELDGRLGELLCAPGLAALTALDLSDDHLDDQDATLLAQAELPGLRALELAGNDLDDRGVEELARARGPRRLERLGLAGNVVELDGVRALAASPLPLVELDLAQPARADAEPGNSIGPAALAALVTRPWRRLVLSGNPVVNAGAEVLAGADLGLEELVAVAAHIGPSGAFALAASPHLAGLRRLDLGGNPLGDEGARALASSPFLPAGLELDVSGCGVSPVAREALAQRFPRALS
jgi:hypothetical protein